MTHITTDKKSIDELLTRSVAEILPTREGLREALLSGRRLRIYIGTDATGTSLHLGHATNYMILEKFRRLGHEIIFLVGDFTARIGDPTDKGDAARKQLTREQVQAHVKTWIDQVRPVIDVDNTENPVRVLFNHDWLAALTFEDVVNLASNFTVQQMIERDMFQKRMESGKPLYLHELFYPLMQGYDSVAMDVDIELCGSDQKFNALAGRTLLKKLKNKEKFVFITTLLENPVTREKMMSKSLGTGVFLDSDASAMFGGIMSQADENMKQLFVDCTWLEIEEIEKIMSVLPAGNPRDVKMRLAYEIVSIYHGEAAAREARDEFERVFSEGGAPDEVPRVTVTQSPINVIDLLVEAGLVSSRGDAKRLVVQKAVYILGKTIDDVNAMVDVSSEILVKVGKRRFANVVVDGKK